MPRLFRILATPQGVILENVPASSSSSCSQQSELLLPAVLFDAGRGGSPRLLHQQQQQQQQPPTAAGSLACFGVLGVVRLLAAPCLLVATAVEGFGGGGVFRVAKTALVQLRPPRRLGPAEDAAQRRFAAAVAAFCEGRELCFCDAFDLTSSAQRRAAVAADPALADAPAWMRADSRFFWNMRISEPLIACGLDDWVLPLIDGHVSVVHSKAEEQNSFVCMFVARRGCERAGMRFRTRGVDSHGHAANFVESEQLVIMEDSNIVSSFVQTRGSVPLMWEQRVQRAIGSKFVFAESKNSDAAFRRHFEEQLRIYGPQFIVNLVDQTGKEAELGSSYERHVRLLNDPRIKYYAFDFHAQTKGNKFENMAILLSMVESDLHSTRYFLQSHSGEVVMRQEGVFRTNCVDCLDRTGVAQSTFAREVMHIQLQQLGLITSRDDIESTIPDLGAHMRSSAADSADYLSLQYTGSRALKTDFTRKGTRSVRGNILDGVNAVRRIVHQQFQDATVQEEIDIFLGNYAIDRCAAASHRTADLDSAASSSSSSSPSLESSDRVDGLFVFNNVVMIDHMNGKQRHAVILRVDTSKNVLAILEPQEFLRKDVPLSSIFDVERGLANFKQVNLWHERDPFPCRLIFSSSQERQHFLNVLAMHAPQLSAATALETPTQLNICLVTWNAEGCETPYMAIPLLLRPRADLYVVALQRCDYRTPPEVSSMSCSSHWHYWLQLFLGWDEYTTISLYTTTQTTLCVLAKRSLVPFVHNVFSCSAKLVPFKLRKINATAPTESPRNPKREDPEVVGGAVCLQVHETALCFVNLYLDPLRSAHRWSDRFLQLKSGVELNDFHHVFALGKVSQTSELSGALAGQWIELASEGNNTKVVYRPLPGSSLNQIEPLSTSSEGNPLYGRHPPLALSLQLAVQPPLATPLSLNVPVAQFVISVSALRAFIEIWQSIQQSSNLDAFVVLDAPFLLESRRTCVCKKSTRPSWEEDVQLESFVCDSEYLQRQHLRMEVWNKGITHDALVARGALELHKAVCSPGKPATFNAELTCRGRAAGWLSGSVVVTPTGASSATPGRRKLVAQRLSRFIVSEDYFGSSSSSSSSSSSMHASVPLEIPQPAEHEQCTACSAPLPAATGRRALLIDL